MTDPTTTVLLVDESRDFTDLFVDFVEYHYDDISIHVERSDAGALAYLESADEVDCVVSDHRMPNLDGLGLLVHVRERRPNLPFILFTDRGSEEVILRAVEAGVTDFLRKRGGTKRLSVLVGQIRNLVTQYRSVTQLKEAALRTDAQFRLLIDTVEDYAIFFLDEEGVIQTWSRGGEKIKGYSADEVVGEHFSMFYREEDVATGAPERNLHEATVEGRVRDEGWRVRKDGTEFWADVTVTALYEGDDLLGYAKITRDSTQRHRERELLDQKAQLEELIATISHDLRSPLAVAQGNVELAREAGDLSRLEVVTRALVRATELLDFLGRLAEEGKEVTQPEPIDLRESAEAAWTFVETDGAELEVEGSVTLVADRNRLQQLLDNLFTNALEHGSTSSETGRDDTAGRAGATVTVRVGPLDEDGFYVEDDGPGIPEEERPHVFEMGYTTDDDGTGFGLAICERVANVQGWFIAVSEGADGGARFEISDVEVL